jgi:hypothetical protein
MCDDKEVKSFCPTCGDEGLIRSVASGFRVPCPTCRAAGPRFTPGLADTTCYHGNTPSECRDCERKRREWVDRVQRSDTRHFRLSEIGVEQICLDSEPSKSTLAPDFVDIVVTVHDRAGNIFEISRVTCKYDGMLGEWHGAARLIAQKTWESVEGDGYLCPLCYDRGHGAGLCPPRGMR